MAKRLKKTVPPPAKQRESVPRPTSLQGRETEIALIDQLLGRIDLGGSALVIRGAAGIGKSAVLEEAKSRARERGITVLSMTGVQAEVHIAFAGLEQALRPLMKQAKSLAPRQRSALLSAFGVSDDAAAIPDIRLVALATLTLLTGGADHKPILLLADDAQWFDEATRDVLSFVSRRLRSDPIVMLLAVREGFDFPFGDADTLRHVVPALGDADAARLLDVQAPELSSDLRSRFLKEAAGNPLALLELPRAIQAAYDGEARWLPLTERLELAFCSRVSELPNATRTLMSVAAANDGTSPHEIMRACEVVLDGSVGVDAFAPAVSAKLIEFDATEVRFRHPLVRSAIRQAADVVTRQRVHAALATIIEDQDRRLWHRAAATVGPDDELAAEHDLMATRARRRGSIAMVVEILQVAAKLSSTTKARSERLLRAAEFAVDLGRPELLQRLLGGAEVDGSDELGAARIGWCREMSQLPIVSDPGKISALVGFADQARAAGAKSLASNLLFRAAQRCWWSSASSDVRASVLAAANRLDVPDLDPRFIAISAYVEPLRRGGEVYAKLNALSVTGTGKADILRVLGSAANIIGAFDLGVSFLGESSAELRKQARIGNLPRVLFVQAWSEMEIGDWVGAARQAEEAVCLAEETGASLWAAAAMTVKANVAGMQGNLEQCEAYARQVERLFLSTGAGFLLAMLQMGRGIAAIGAGRHSEAFEHLQRLFASADPAFHSGLQLFALADFVEAAVYSERSQAVRGLIDDIERMSAPKPVPWVETMLSYGKALLATDDDAERFFLQGLGQPARNWPFLRGRLLLGYGAWLRRQRRPANARAPLREARDIFDALGASPWSDRAREELRAAGEASLRRTEQIWERLTPQELHIAQLAAQGLSNKVIGARLYLSHRTVGYHLHHVFSKTGITSRSGLGPVLSKANSPAT
ncbi:AAA family ATPase [Bradyrhizobium sp. RD5-C2]|uniref:ATP-binding protein n=1 Tax=Bradyrhizobium sp. RD5-C2 TaxID=244562 RepID=UPI001CC6767F|nr:LuxR family transcriptional regulator [Bradyrhizobium sp. RD5-C2]GIQ78278.1 LuxR family transcriptional regulator [Bradyrhizobium sp. RD5-C2]